MHFVGNARKLKDDLDKGVNQFHRSRVAPSYLNIYREIVIAFCSELKENIASLIDESELLRKGNSDTYLCTRGPSKFRGVTMIGAIKNIGFSVLFEHDPKSSQYQIANFDFN